MGIVWYRFVCALRCDAIVAAATVLRGRNKAK